MADNGRWFKLWTTALEDPALDNLSIADFGRWAKFGAYLKVHGNNGEIILSSPSRILCAAMQLSTFEECLGVISSMPNCTVEETTILPENGKSCNGTHVTNTTVTYRVKWENWLKYQGDYSGDRVAKFRSKNLPDVTVECNGDVTKMKRTKKRREEKRREDIPPAPKGGSAVTDEFMRFYSAYPKHEDKQDAIKAWHGLNGKRPPLEVILTAIENQKRGRKWQEGYIKSPASWLRKGCWEDEIDMRCGNDGPAAPIN